VLAQSAGAIAGEYAQLISLLGIFVTLVIHAWVQQRKLAWDRASLTSNLVSQWDERTERQRQTIEDMFGFYWNKDSIDLGGREKEFALAAKGDPSGFFEIREAVILLLNWFEDFAALYRQGMLDTVIANHLMKPPIKKYYFKIRPLMSAINLHLLEGEPGWPILDELMEDWANARSPRPIEATFFTTEAAQ
jgi:hypothetical protein